MPLFPPELKLRGKLDRFVFIEAIFNTGAGAVGQIQGLAGNLILLATALKVFGQAQLWWVVLLVGLAYLVGVFGLGLFLFRKNIIMRRGNLTNKISNPQLLGVEETLRRIEQKVERVLEEQARR